MPGKCSSHFRLSMMGTIHEQILSALMAESRQPKAIPQFPSNGKAYLD